MIKRSTVIDIISRYSYVASEPPIDKEDEAVLKTLHQILREIKSIPSVDSMKHGKWLIDVDDNDYEYGVCSVCGYTEWDAFPRGDFPKHCSGCGACMDGGKTNWIQGTPKEVGKAMKEFYDKHFADRGDK